MWDAIILSELMMSRSLHTNSKQMYESIRSLYKTPEDMDKDRDMFLDTINKSHGEYIYFRMQTHITKNFLKTKHQINKRNKRMTKDEVKESIFNEELYKTFSKLSMVKYKQIRNYAFRFHKLSDAEFSDEFLIDFLPEFLQNV